MANLKQWWICYSIHIYLYETTTICRHIMCTYVHTCFILKLCLWCPVGFTTMKLRHVTTTFSVQENIMKRIKKNWDLCWIQEFGFLRYYSFSHSLYTICRLGHLMLKWVTMCSKEFTETEKKQCEQREGGREILLRRSSIFSHSHSKGFGCLLLCCQQYKYWKCYYGNIFNTSYLF